MSLATVQHASIGVELGIRIPMRDGVSLAADLYRPSGAGRWPVILLRTPYDRRLGAASGQQVHATRLAAAGYAVVVQDVRGRLESEGAFTPFVHEAEDGFDTIDWLARQPWTNGSIGMVGSSYAGSTQVLAARANHPALKAWFPAFTTLDIRDGWAYEGDAFCLGFNLTWIIGLAMRDRRTTDIAPLVAAMDRWCETVKRPITDHPELAATPAGWVYQRWIDERDNATYWKAISGRGVKDVSAPAAQIGGWFDLFATGTFDLHQELARGVAGSQHRLIIGPWDHSALPPGTGAGNSDFGPLAGFDLVGAHRQWFDWLLCEESEPDWPAARTFLTGWNRWSAWSAWPPPGTAQAWYLQPNGQLGPGLASPATDHFLTDANDPTPTVGGRLCCAPYLLRSGQYDQSARSERPDVRSYVSEPLEGDLLVAGPVNAAIWSVSSSPAADIHVTLSDLQPGGRALYLADGICRRSQLDTEAVCFDVRLGQIGHAFRAGHRIQVDIAGTSFPRFDRIPETGTTARSILLGDSNPSQITLPIVQ
jgi:uncharacterized protein